MDIEREFFSRIATSNIIEESKFDTYFDSFKPGYDVIKPVLSTTASIFDNCTACNASGDAIYTDEQVVCLKCGEVLGRPLDTSAEYRFFGADERCGGDAASIIGDATGCPVTMVNDADAAGEAETRFGAARGKSGVVMTITLGTGIGSCIRFCRP